MSHSPKRVRADQLLVQRGLTDSREKAQRLILAGKVLISHQPAAKPGQLVSHDAIVEVKEELKYVSRGGYKLEAALDKFQVDVTNCVVADIGVSTGGFTDCLLQRGARKVYAVDVGYGQIAWKLRTDPRVILLERTNARSLRPDSFADRIDLAVMDVSFIGAEKILQPLSAITDEVILLLKPQFEAGPENVPSGGVIRDASTHRKVLETFFREVSGWSVHNLIDSPIAGSSGNREFLVHLKKTSGWSPKQYLSRVEELLQ